MGCNSQRGARMVSAGLSLAVAVCLMAWLSASAAFAGSAPGSLAEVAAAVQPKVVKIFGAGGYRGLEHYQSGFLISPDGDVLTVWSYVLDTESIQVVLHDGRALAARVVGVDPRLEVALLKIEAQGLDHFDLDAAERASVGARVLAFSNLYGVATGDEPASVQHGVVSAVTRLEARRGVFETPYRGPVYVLDAITNNPGAAGGALTDRRGRLLGMLGKELRNAQTNTWLNYAVPVDVLREVLPQLREGRVVQRDVPPAISPENALNPELLGLILVPDVLERTPPFIDVVLPDSPAARAGLLPDDLVLFVNDRLVQSCKALRAELERVDRLDIVRLTVIRGQQLIEVELAAGDPAP